MLNINKSITREDGDEAIDKDETCHKHMFYTMGYCNAVLINFKVHRFSFLELK